MRSGDGVYPWVQLRYVAKPGTGHTPSRERPELWKPEECTIPWFTLADVWQIRDTNVTMVETTEERVSSAGIAASAAVVHPAGTVLLSRTASVGFSAVMGVDMAVSQDYMTWTPGPRIEAQFLVYILRGLRPEFAALMTGSTHKTIYMPDLLALRGPVPPIAAQREIASFLDIECARIDELRAEARTLGQLNEENVDAVRSRVLRGDELGTALARGVKPAGWPTIRTFVDAWMSGGTPPSHVESYWASDSQGQPWMTIGDMSGRRSVSKSARKLTPAGLAAARLQPAPAGTLLLAMYASVGEVAELEVAATFNQALIGMHVLDSVRREFVFEWLTLMKHFWPWFTKSSTQANLSAELVRTAPITPLEPTEQVSALASISDARVARDAVLAELVALESSLLEYRAALITDAVTGRLDLSRLSEQQLRESAQAAVEGQAPEVLSR